MITSENQETFVAVSFTVGANELFMCNKVYNSRSTKHH